MVMCYLLFAMGVILPFSLSVYLAFCIHYFGCETAI